MGSILILNSNWYVRFDNVALLFNSLSNPSSSVADLCGCCERSLCACRAHSSNTGSTHVCSMLWAGEICPINTMWHEIITALAKHRGENVEKSHTPPPWINKLTFMIQAYAQVAVILTSPLAPDGWLSIFSVKELNINHLPAVHCEIQYTSV